MVKEYLKDDQSDEYIRAKRLAVSIGMEMGRGHEGDELVDRVVSRYENDDRMMDEYDNDTHRLREDVELMIETLPDEFQEERQAQHEAARDRNRKQVYMQENDISAKDRVVGYVKTKLGMQPPDWAEDYREKVNEASTADQDTDADETYDSDAAADAAATDGGATDETDDAEPTA